MRKPLGSMGWVLLIGIAPGVARAKSVPGDDARSDYAPIAVIQATPGLHLSLSGGKLGVSASLDVLGGVVLNGKRCFCITPGVVGGGFAEVQAVWNQGVTRTVGWRAGGGALGPTLGGGYIPFGMVTYDQGRSVGALSGRRTGVHARSLVGGASVNRMEDQTTLFTLGFELPLLPVMAVE
jgi:hypothetical protein